MKSSGCTVGSCADADRHPAMTSRLATIAPDLVEAITSAREETVRAISDALPNWVVQEVNLADPRVIEGLAALREQRCGESGVRTAVKAAADELDKRSWDVQELLEKGVATDDQYFAVFACARAATAVWYALSDDPLIAALESAYEAQAATGATDEVRRIVYDVIQRTCG